MNDGLLKAQEFVTTLQKQGIPISQAVLFGSWAKGSATPQSDIDVCVVSDTFGVDYIAEMVRLRKIALTVDSRIEPIPFTTADLHDRLSSFATEIRNHSIMVI